MCECLTYSDGTHHLCECCVDIVRDCPECGLAVFGVQRNVMGYGRDYISKARCRELIVRAILVSRGLHTDESLRADQRYEKAEAIADRLLAEAESPPPAVRYQVKPPHPNPEYFEKPNRDAKGEG